MSEIIYCPICGKKLSLIGIPIYLKKGSKKRICNNCSNLIMDLKDKIYMVEYEKRYNQLKSYEDTISDEETKEVISEILKNALDNITQRRQENSEQANADLLKQQMIQQFEQQFSSHMLTTGYNFEGYIITSYQGLVSGESVLGTGFLSEFTASISDLVGTQSSSFASKLEIAKDNAIKNLVYNSIKKSGNAIIGVDFDYITFSNNMIGVVANGTSVIIKKIED